MMTTIIRRLPAPVAFCLVVFLCSWWAIYASFVAIAHHSWGTMNRSQEVFVGIGVELELKDQNVTIRQVVPNAPASKAGLSSGLIIQKIDGTPTDGKLLKDCADRIRGPRGSKVRLCFIARRG